MTRIFLFCGGSISPSLGTSAFALVICVGVRINKDLLESELRLSAFAASAVIDENRLLAHDGVVACGTCELARYNVPCVVSGSVWCRTGSTHLHAVTFHSRIHCCRHHTF